MPPNQVAGGEPPPPTPTGGDTLAPDTNPYMTGSAEEQHQTPPSPIEIARMLRDAAGSDRLTLQGRPLQLGGGKDPDLRQGRGEIGQAFATGPIVPFIIPSLGGGSGGAGGGGTDGGSGGIPDIPGSAEGGRTPRIIEPISVDPIGWDFANLDQSNFTDGAGGNIQTGFIDYIINVPLETVRPDPLSPGEFLDPDVLTVTLVWLREIFIEDQNFLSCTDPRIGTFSVLELENLELEIFLADGLGNPISTTPIASSESVLSTEEHLFLEIPQTGTYLIRVRWEGTDYDVFANRALAEQRFALAWRVDFSPRPGMASADSASFASLATVLNSWGGTIGDRSNPYNLDADITRDGKIDFADITAVLRAWNN